MEPGLGQCQKQSPKATFSEKFSTITLGITIHVSTEHVRGNICDHQSPTSGVGTPYYLIE